MIRDSPQFALGASGEQAVSSWLKQRGFYVVPTGLIERGGAPLLEGHLRSIVLPDIQAFGRSGAAWVEVKTKTNRSKHHISGRWEHGIDTPLWHSYLSVQDATKIAGFIAILEPLEREMRIGSLDALALMVRIRATPGIRRAYRQSHDLGMAYFELDDFELCVKIGEKELSSAIERAETLRRAVSSRWMTSAPSPQHKQLSMFSAVDLATRNSFGAQDDH